jgi:hypothetical protein
MHGGVRTRTANHATQTARFKQSVRIFDETKNRVTPSERRPDGALPTGATLVTLETSALEPTCVESRMNMRWQRY